MCTSIRSDSCIHGVSDGRLVEDTEVLRRLDSRTTISNGAALRRPNYAGALQSRTLRLLSSAANVSLQPVKDSHQIAVQLQRQKRLGGLCSDEYTRGQPGQAPQPCLGISRASSLLRALESSPKVTLSPFVASSKTNGPMQGHKANTTE